MAVLEKFEEFKKTLYDEIKDIPFDLIQTLEDIKIFIKKYGTGKNK